MKAYISFRSTLSNVSWLQRGVAALVMAALIFTLALAWRANLQPPAARPPAAIPAAQPSANSTSLGIRSPYDSSAYVEYLTPRMPIVAPPVAAPNPNMPVIGAGSAYDGGSYVTHRPSVRNPNTPAIGTGSAYDGQ
jgi:hypothetical protein